MIAIPNALDPFIVIEEFWDKQKASLKKFKDEIINNWIPEVSTIYKKQITELNRSQIKSSIFFDSSAAHLHIALRNLLAKELNRYLSFIQAYKKEEINPPDTVVFLERTRNLYEECFLNVRLSHRKDEIYFMDNL